MTCASKPFPNFHAAHRRTEMMPCLENFQAPAASIVGMPTRKGKFGRRRAVQAEQQRQQNSVEPERDEPGKPRDQLADGHGDDDGPGDFIAQFFPAQPPFDGEEGNATDEQCPGQWVRGFPQV